jgi:predicted aspartyl protease
MTGKVDDAGRALLSIRLRHPSTGVETDAVGWIDTGFTGDLVLPQSQIAALGLSAGLAVGAILADGSHIIVDTYACLIEWFGAWKETEVLTNTGQFPLIGIGLLRQRELQIDYRVKVVSVD